MSTTITPNIGLFHWKLKHWKIFKFSPPQKKHPKIRFFRKKAPKTTSGSGFHVIFEFCVLDLIENDINIDRCSWQFFEILGSKMKNLKIMQMSYVHSARKIYVALRSHCWPLLSLAKNGSLTTVGKQVSLCCVLARNFAKCWTIFKILSPKDSMVNLQWNHC